MTFLGIVTPLETSVTFVLLDSKELLSLYFVELISSAHLVGSDVDNGLISERLFILFMHKWPG